MGGGSPVLAEGDQPHEHHAALPLHAPSAGHACVHRPFHAPEAGRGAAARAEVRYGERGGDPCGTRGVRCRPCDAAQGVPRFARESERGSWGVARWFSCGAGIVDGWREAERDVCREGSGRDVAADGAQRIRGAAGARDADRGRSEGRVGGRVAAEAQGAGVEASGKGRLSAARCGEGVGDGVCGDEGLSALFGRLQCTDERGAGICASDEARHAGLVARSDSGFPIDVRREGGRCAKLLGGSPCTVRCRARRVRGYDNRLCRGTPPREVSVLGAH